MRSAAGGAGAERFVFRRQQLLRGEMHVTFAEKYTPSPTLQSANLHQTRAHDKERRLSTLDPHRSTRQATAAPTPHACDKHVRFRRPLASAPRSAYATPARGELRSRHRARRPAPVELAARGACRCRRSRACEARRTSDAASAPLAPRSLLGHKYNRLSPTDCFIQRAVRAVGRCRRWPPP